MSHSQDKATVSWELHGQNSTKKWHIEFCSKAKFSKNILSQSVKMCSVWNERLIKMQIFVCWDIKRCPLQEVSVYETVEIRITLKMKEAYSKLFKMDCNGTLKILYWGKASFNDRCSKNLKNCNKNSTKCLATDNLFNFYEPRTAFRKFCCTSFTVESEPLTKLFSHIWCFSDKCCTIVQVYYKKA